MPDLGISTMEDVLIDARRIVDATQMPLLVDIDTGWGGAFNIARTIKSLIEASASPPCTWKTRSGRSVAAIVRARKSCRSGEMVDRVKAAVDARTDAGFVIMARTDAPRSKASTPRSIAPCAYVEAGADMIFPEAMKSLDDYRRFKAP